MFQIIKNIISNIYNYNFIKVVFGKIINRVKPNRSEEALIWAKSKVKYTTEDFCNLIDRDLFENIRPEIESLNIEAKNILNKLNLKVGGSGNYILLYFLVRKLKPLNIVETGVASGWSSLAMLKGIQKNKCGMLFSSDFPYLRIDKRDYIGILVQDEKLKKNWYLNINGDENALPKIIAQLNDKKINLFHYDSDKSYSGRQFACNILRYNFDKNCIIIFDDIQNNLHFRDYVKNNNKKFIVLEFNKKYLGIIGHDSLLPKA